MTEQLLAAAFGRDFEVAAQPSPTERVSVDLTFEGDRLLMGANREVVAEFRVPSGQHLYSEPVPKGLMGTTIELDDNPGILSYRPRDRLASDDEAHTQSAV